MSHLLNVYWREAHLEEALRLGRLLVLACEEFPEEMQGAFGLLLPAVEEMNARLANALAKGCRIDEGLARLFQRQEDAERRMDHIEKRLDAAEFEKQYQKSGRTT